MRMVAVALALGSCLVSACAVQGPTYHWGQYEDLLYDMYRRPGQADPALQIAKLSEDIERAHGTGLAVPPGVHAHLGYMFYLQGNLEAAKNEFETESRLYPESAIFMQRLLAGTARPESQP